MKKGTRILLIYYFILIILLIWVGVAMAETTWRPTNQGTIQWVAPTVLSNNDPIPSGDSVTYNIHIKNEDGTGVAMINGDVQCCSYTASFPDEGRYYVGVSATRIASTGFKTVTSISWSDDPVHANKVGVFGYEYYLALKQVFGLEPK